MGNFIDLVGIFNFRVIISLFLWIRRATVIFIEAAYFNSTLTLV